LPPRIQHKSVRLFVSFASERHRNRWAHQFRQFGALAALALGSPAAAHAQWQGPPERPDLPANADHNDWSAYYDKGVALLRGDPAGSEAAFYWASRIAPQRAEPLFARWVAFHNRDQRRFLAYLDDDRKTLADPAVRAADSLRLRAMIRNPFLHRGLEIALYDQMGGNWGYDDFSRGLLAYAQPNFPSAVALLGRAIKSDQKGYLWQRLMLAQAFVGMANYDSAFAEVQTIRTALDRRDAKKLVVVYDSREFLDYAMALLESARGNAVAAREDLGRALLENPGYYAAHLMLGDDAYAAKRDSVALGEYESALLIEPRDAVLQYHYARSLTRAGRLADAARALKTAVELEPYYAAPWLDLGRVLARTNDPSGARGAFATFLERAPRDDQANIRAAREALAALTPNDKP
jgi:tetratricopeptide (TPR) repeat protein